MQRQVVQISGEMMRSPTVQDPIVWIVWFSRYKISSRLPEVRLRRGAAHNRVTVCFHTVVGSIDVTMAMHTAKLTTALIATRWLIGARVSIVVLLSWLSDAVVVVVTVAIVVVAIVA